MPIPILGTARSESELFRLAATAADAHPGKLLLFRGQTGLHPTIQSGKARGLRVVGEVEIAWSRLAARMLGVKNSDAPGVRFSKALLQHYGLPTQFIDLTSSPSIAAWFASHESRFMRFMWAGLDSRSFKRVKYAHLDQGYGYVLVLALPEPRDLESAGQLFCLSQLPLEVLRPHRQLGWLFYDGVDASHDINELCHGAIQIDRQSFDLPNLSQDRLFPPPSVDTAYRDLLGFPWVQTPSIYFKPEDREEPPPEQVDEEFRKASERWCFADRAQHAGVLRKSGRVRPQMGRHYALRTPPRSCMERLAL